MTATTQIRTRKTAPLPTGGLKIPAQYGLQTEVRIFAPERAGLATPLSLQKNSGRPRPNVSMRRYAATSNNPRRLLSTITQELSRTAPSFTSVERDLARFADGREGPRHTVRFEAMPGRVVVQLHTIRVDGPIATHFIATVAAGDERALAEDLLPIIESFEA